MTHEQMAEAVGATAATRAAALALEAVFANEEPMASEVATAQAAFAVACELAQQTSVLGAIKGTTRQARHECGTGLVSPITRTSRP